MAGHPEQWRVPARLERNANHKADWGDSRLLAPIFSFVYLGNRGSGLT